MRRFRRIRCRDTAVPLVKRLAAEMARQRIGPQDLAERSGVSFETIRRWFERGGNPTVENLNAAFGVLGQQLIPVDRELGDDPYAKGHHAGYVAGRRAVARQPKEGVEG